MIHHFLLPGAHLLLPLVLGLRIRCLKSLGLSSVEEERRALELGGFFRDEDVFDGRAYEAAHMSVYKHSSTNRKKEREREAVRGW